jgi:hypothetical protein
MQKRMALSDAERRNEAIDRLLNGATSPSQRPVIACGLAGQIDAAGFEHFKFQQDFLDLFGRFVVAETLQHFAEDDVGQRETLPIQFLIQPVGLGTPRAAQIVDPDSCIDDDHATLSAEPRQSRPIEIALPRHRSAEAPDTGLASGLNQ